MLIDDREYLIDQMFLMETELSIKDELLSCIEEREAKIIVDSNNLPNEKLRTFPLCRDTKERIHLRYDIST